MALSAPHSAESGRGDERPLSLAARLRLWRSGLIASPRFRRFVGRLPLLRPIANRKANALFRLTAGFVDSRVLMACQRFGLFDLLAGTGLHTGELARQTGLGAGQMAFLLDQAKRLGLVSEPEPDLWMLADLGAVIAGDPGLAAMIRHHDMFYRDLDKLEDLLTGAPIQTELHQFWRYARSEGAEHLRPEEVAPYSSLMRLSQSMMADCVLATHDFRRYRSLLDVGGGDGAFLAAVGAAHPDLDLVLFDLPAVAERARAHLRDLGFGDRSRILGGDFKSTPLPGDVDAVTLIRVLCDHDDDAVRDLLARLYAAMRPGARILVAEAMAGQSEGARQAATYFSLYFLAMGSGRCRSAQEVSALLKEAGFLTPRIADTTNPLIATLVTATR